MQRMGGGSQRGGSQPTTGQRGGGNDPSCGCDMQAGWPSASDLPRGGVQGGGANMNAINSFNLALTNKTGKITHFRGQRNNAMNNNAMNNNAMNNNVMNNNAINNNAMNNNAINNNAMNNINNTNNNNSYRSRKTNMTKRNKNKNKKRTTSAPNNLNKVVVKGNRYYTNKNTGNTYKRSKSGNVGNYVGKLVENNGKKSLNASVPESKPLTKIQSPPLLEDMTNNIDIESEGTNEVNVQGGTPLTQDGGGGCSLSSALQSLKMAGGGMPVPGACPFPGTGYCDFYARGGQRGGGCGCSAGLLKGGYRPTKKNRNALKRWRKGESIGFTMTSSLKAKGLIPRTSKTLKGKKVVSRKYR